MYFAIITNYTSTFAMELNVNDEITQLQLRKAVTLTSFQKL